MRTVIGTQEFNSIRQLKKEKTENLSKARKKMQKNSTETDTLISKEEYFAKLERGFENIKEGKGKKMSIKQVNEILGIYDL